MDELISQINPIKYTKTYSKPYNFGTEIVPDLKPCDFKFNEDVKTDNSSVKLEEYDKKVLNENECNLEQKNPLTTKDAVKYLIEGILKEKVCRYCLNTSSKLSNLDELITIARDGTLFSIAIKHMIASFHPVKINDDPNFPTKICQTCLDRTINSYLFAQQCDQSERALRDCFEDMYEKVLKLDPLERTKRRGRYKLKPNYNVLHTEHKYVINYAEPTIHINSTAVQLPNELKINDLECLKCSQVLPDTISLLNHVKSHPKSQWFNCRLCGKSFPKLFHLKKHFRQFHSTTNTNDNKSFKCNDCGMVLENYQQFYQHKEKHKFRTVMKHLISCKMDKLCTICLDKGSHMIEIDEYVNLHGGFPELTGDKSVLSMVAATLPEKNYKYQELLIARNANKITIKKKITFKKPHNFVLSRPIIFALENIEINDDYIYLFNAPRKIDEENNFKEPESKKKRYDENKDNNDIPIDYGNPNEFTLMDSHKDPSKIISKKYKYAFSKPNNIIEIDSQIAAESIKKSCKECWIFRNSCAKCDGSIKLDSKSKCNLCWIFKNLDKCENCKKFIDQGKVDKVKNNAKANKIGLSKNMEAIKNTKNILLFKRDIPLKEKKPWKCAICLTYNKVKRESCFCCEYKTYKDTTNFNFNSTSKSFGILENSKKDTKENIKILDNYNINNKISEIKEDYLCSANVNTPTIPTKFEGNISKIETENTVNYENLPEFANSEIFFPEYRSQNMVTYDKHNIEMETESADFETLEKKLGPQNWKHVANEPETVESMDVEEMSMDQINTDIQKSLFPQAPLTNFEDFLTKSVQFAIGSGEKLKRKRPFKKVMNILANHTGTKICQKCYSHILASYLFVTKTYSVRNKLDSCITHMLQNLTNIQPQKNLCIEISQNFIMPEIDINIIKSIEADETKIEVLEDEFRIESDSQSEEETKGVKNKVELKNKDIVESKSKDTLELKAKDNVELTKVNSVKSKSKSKTLNGYQKDVSEFLTFKKKKPIRIKYTCPLCSKNFVSGYFLKRHILKHGNKKVFCNSCNVTFNSLFGLFEHNKIIHSKTEIHDYWTCNICERIFIKHTKFLVHRKQHSRRVCQLCDKVYRSQYNYNNHMQRHLKKLRYIKEQYMQTCSFCEKVCSNDNELSLHVNKVHLQIKPYVCDMCDQQFYTEHNLRCHKKVHNLYSREKCSFCRKCLSSRAKFVVHLRKHIGVKPFTCQICFEEFFSETKLKKHLRVHLGNFR